MIRPSTRAIAIWCSLVPLVAGAVPADGPVSLKPGAPLPFPIVDEPQPRAPDFVAPSEIAPDLVYLTVPGFISWKQSENALGNTLYGFESASLRKSTIEKGKVTIPAGALGYVTEPWPGAVPLARDVVYLKGKPLTVVDVDQVVAVRQDVTLPAGRSVVVGSNVFSYEVGFSMVGSFAATIGIAAISGLDWSAVGTGSIALSMTEPSWQPTTFRRGLYQGVVDQVGPEGVHFRWISSNRMDTLLAAEKTEFKGRLRAGDVLRFPGGAELTLGKIDAHAKRLEITTPDGPRTLAADFDLARLPEDSEARKKIIWRGGDKAVVFVPMLSQLDSGEAHLEVFTHVRTFRYGELLDDDAAWRVYPIGCYTGHSAGLYLVNDKPIELTPKSATALGPEQAFKVVTTWSSTGELASFHLEDASGGKSLDVATKGRESIDFLAGDGPTVRGLLRIVGPAPAQQLAAIASGSAPPPAPPPVAQLTATTIAPAATDAPGIGFKFTWSLVGAAFAGLAFFALGMRRRRA